MARSPRISIIDNGDGTWIANALRDSDILLSEEEPGLFTIFNANATYLDVDTYEVSNMTEEGRPELQTLLVSILGSDNVYFQPPASILLDYPCIVYNRSNVNIEYADNSPYKNMKRYQVTVIDKDPDSLIPDKVAMLPLCSYDRFFAADNLNHDVFTLFF